MNYYNPLLQQMQPIQMPQNNIVNVPSEDMARNYPVAPGNTIIFKHDNAPYIYTKTIIYWKSVSRTKLKCFGHYKY